MKRLYFDYNATAPLARGLVDELRTWAAEDPKNPSSAHADGRAAKTMVEQSRKRILNLLGADTGDKLFFTSGGTESNNTVLNSAFLGRGARNKLVLTRVEHSCIYNYAKFLETRGVALVWLDVDSKGRLDLDGARARITPEVFLACVMLANNETGFIFPVADLAAICREQGVPLHCDAVCAVGKIPVDFTALGADTMSFSSHKFGGLKGAGGVIAGIETRLSPYLIGGPQEDEKRAGTQNVIGIKAGAYALNEWCRDLNGDQRSESDLRERLKQRISKAFPAAGFIESATQLPQTLSAAFPGLNGNLLLTNLDLEGVSVSFGSACASGSLEVSRVMRELGLKFDDARSALRFSFGKGTTVEDVDDLGERLQIVIGRMGG